MPDSVFKKLKTIIDKRPGLLLLIFVYLYILPKCLSYDNAWMQCEEFNIKRCVLVNGPNFTFNDLQNGLNWRQFENWQPRCSRPLSSYFEIIDTKFRSWAWHYILPHPSLSLTWIFSLILAPVFLYRLLRNRAVSPNVAMSLVAFYLVTPGVLSCEVMLFRPAKPMTNFFIILCLYAASQLKKKFTDLNHDIPAGKFLCFWGLLGFSLYWDETAWLIFPAVLIFFPQIFKNRRYLLLFFILPAITLISYFVIIPYLSVGAGYDFPHLMSYTKIFELGNAGAFDNAVKFLGINAKNLILETMGIIVPFSSHAPLIVKLFIGAAAISWAGIFYYVSLRALLFRAWQSSIFFLIGLILFFDYLMAITNEVWGPYYYGAFWSVFFVFSLAHFIEKAHIPKYILTGFFFLIIMSMFYCFIATNTIYKKYHFYPCDPKQIRFYFKGERKRFDPSEKPLVAGGDLKAAIKVYWEQSKQGRSFDYSYLPRELYWLPIELEPNRSHPRYALPESDINNFNKRS